MFKQEAYFENFKKMGWPTTKNEDWKYTSLKDLQAQDFSLPNQIESKNFESYLSTLSLLKTYMVFIDGCYHSGLSKLPSQNHIEIIPMVELVKKASTEIKKDLEKFNCNRSLNLLNMSQFKDGAYIKVKSEFKDVLGLVFITTQKNVQNHIRNIIKLEPNSKAKILECYKGFDQIYFNNILTTISLAEDSSLELYKVQEEGVKAFHISNTEVIQSSKSHFESHQQSFGAKLGRNEISVILNGSHASCKLYGLYAAASNQHVDHLTFVDHAVSDCQSDELYKGILDGKSHGVFSGQVLVRENAQKTDAQQANKNLLLSDDAQIDTKPQLMINADDVKCSHGATVGQLDKTAVFYLQSRGIGINQAKQILTRAFATEMIEKINDTKIRDYFDKVLQVWFNHQTLH